MKQCSYRLDATKKYIINLDRTFYVNISNRKNLVGGPKPLPNQEFGRRGRGRNPKHLEFMLGVIDNLIYLMERNQAFLKFVSYFSLQQLPILTRSFFSHLQYARLINIFAKFSINFLTTGNCIRCCSLLFTDS